jgi:uncharacterized protein YfiM (DUF2279 family)
VEDWAPAAPAADEEQPDGTTIAEQAAADVARGRELPATDNWRQRRRRAGRQWPSWRLGRRKGAYSGRHGATRAWASGSLLAELVQGRYLLAGTPGTGFP